MTAMLAIAVAIMIVVAIVMTTGRGGGRGASPSTGSCAPVRARRTQRRARLRPGSTRRRKRGAFCGAVCGYGHTGTINPLMRLNGRRKRHPPAMETGRRPGALDCLTVDTPSRRRGLAGMRCAGQGARCLDQGPNPAMLALVVVVPHRRRERDGNGLRQHGQAGQGLRRDR
jgi:hypothetical protein